MGGEPATVLSIVVATTSALAALSAFGVFRRRGNQLVWASTGTGTGAAGDAGVQHDPEIARRIAGLMHDDRDPDVADPASDTEGGMELEDIAGAPATGDPDVPVDALDAVGAVDGVDGVDGVDEIDAVDAGGSDTAAGAPAAHDADQPALAAVDPEELLRRLLVDHVTGLGSRLAWERWVADEQARERRYRRPTTLVVVEVTGLDAVAAFLGSDAAVRVVTEIADIIRANVRTSDHAALVGPARFAMLLPETDEVRAVNFVERVRAGCDRWLEANAPTVGIGFGWASPGASTDLSAARDVADRRLAVDLRDAATGPSRP